MKDKIERLKKIVKLRDQLEDLVLGFDELYEYRIANDLSGSWITLEQAIKRLEGHDDRH